MLLTPVGMVSDLETIVDLTAVTGGYSWKEALGVTAATSAIDASLTALGSVAQSRRAGYGRVFDGQAARRGLAFGAKRGALIGLAVDGIAQGVRYFTK